MSESVINQLMKPENFVLWIIFIVSLFVYDRHMQLKNIEGLKRRIEELEGTQYETHVSSPMAFIHFKDLSNEMAQEFWNKTDLFPLLIQFLDEKERNKFCRINQYFAQIGLADNLNRICLEQRSGFRYPKLLELFKNPVHCTYWHKKRVKNIDAILKNNKEKYYFQESQDKMFKNYVLASVHHTIELLDDLREYMSNFNNHAMNNGNKVLRLVISAKEFKIEIEKNDRETVLAFNINNGNCIISKYEQGGQFDWGYDENGIGIAFDPNENAVSFFDIEQQTIIHNHGLSIAAMLTMPSRIYINMAPGNYDFYFDEWPETWKLDYEIFKHYNYVDL